jgi:hypothetical protein
VSLSRSQLRKGVEDVINRHPVVTTGNVFYVDSGNTTDGADLPAYGESPDSPFLTIDYAVGRCTANNGDYIYVMPGHTETVIADSGIDVDQAGLTIVGLGRGTDRPTITFTTAATADFKLAAANCRAENLLFVAGVDALTGPIELSAAYCELVNCEFQDGATGTIDTIDHVIFTTGADNCLVDGFKLISTSDAGQSAIQIPDGATNPEVRNCYITGDFAVGNIESANTTDLVNFHDNLLINTNATDTCIDVVATCSGSIYRNFMEIATDAQDTSITVDNDCSLYENYFVNLDGQTGGIVGTAST